MQTNKIKIIEIKTLEWFDKTYGNSYFSSDIYVNEDLVKQIPITYGYGSYHEQKALEWLQENIFSKQLNNKIKYDSLYSICKDLINCYYVVNKQDSLKKYLFKG